MKFLKFFLSVLIVSSVLLMSCSSTPKPKSGSLKVPEDYFGMLHAGMNENQYELINDMNIEWLLYTFNWHSIEPERGVFNFDYYDQFVDLAKSNGKKIMVTLGYAANWVTSAQGKNRYVSKEFLPDYLNYVGLLVERYKGKVDAWQIWNEPNFVFWRGSDREFFELTRLAAQKIRDTDPDAYIVGGGLWRTPAGFLKGMHRAGSLENCDAISFHPYAMSPGGSMKLHDSLLKVISEIDFKGDVWINEVGYPTGGMYPTSVSLENFPSHTVKTIVGLACRKSVGMMWYEFSDRRNLGEAPKNASSEYFFGLTYPDGTRKAASYAYQLCSRYLPGSTYTPQNPVRHSNVPSSIASFCFLENTLGSNVLVLWNDRKSTQRIKVTLSSPFTMHNISDGTNTVIEDNSVINVSHVPVFITWEGTATPQISRVSGNQN